MDVFCGGACCRCPSARRCSMLDALLVIMNPYALRADIEEGEELLFDYGENYWLEDDKVVDNA